MAQPHSPTARAVFTRTVAPEGRTLTFKCPGCGCAHGVTVAGDRNERGATWTWNGDHERPTISPSILVNYTLYGPEKKGFADYDGPFPCESSDGVCHSFVRDGRIEFLSDCTHPLAGQTVDLEPWDGA